MAFIRKVKTTSGATAVQIAHKRYGRINRIEHMGSAHTDEELQFLVTLAKQRLQGTQRSLFDTPSEKLPDVGLKQSFSGVLRDVLVTQYIRLGFDQLADEDFVNLCVSRIVEPTSKLDSIRVLADLGVNNIGKDRLYRCLNRIVKKNYRTAIADICFGQANRNGISLVLYDVTTLYFEIQKEDDYRKPGLSKERRLEPQIVVGLLVDQSGFPLGLYSFEGNKAETKTILPVMDDFRKHHHLNTITVVADAAMLSARNLEELAKAGYRYIVGSRLCKIPYGIADYRKTGELTDNQIVTAQGADYRIIYQYRVKRANLDLRNIEKQVTKAEKMVLGHSPVKKAKFLTVKTSHRALNQTLIDKAKSLAGIKGYVTNLDIPNDKVIAYYHQLFQVEASFRMSKSDLKARPVFHHKRDSIEAHLTVVLAALAIGRSIERLTGLSIRQLVKTLRPIRTGTVIIQGKEYRAEAVIPPSVTSLLQKLQTGH